MKKYNIKDINSPEVINRLFILPKAKTRIENKSFHERMNKTNTDYVDFFTNNKFFKNLYDKIMIMKKREFLREMAYQKKLYEITKAKSNVVKKTKLKLSKDDVYVNLSRKYNDDKTSKLANLILKMKEKQKEKEKKERENSSMKKTGFGDTKTRKNFYSRNSDFSQSMGSTIIFQGEDKTGTDFYKTSLKTTTKKFKFRPKTRQKKDFTQLRDREIFRRNFAKSCEDQIMDSHYLNYGLESIEGKYSKVIGAYKDRKIEHKFDKEKVMQRWKKMFTSL